MNELFKKEMLDQLRMIEDISESKRGEMPIESHHEELIRFFSKWECGNSPVC